MKPPVRLVSVPGAPSRTASTRMVLQDNASPRNLQFGRPMRDHPFGKLGAEQRPEHTFHGDDGVVRRTAGYDLGRSENRPKVRREHTGRSIAFTRDQVRSRPGSERPTAW
jgi:hypothetical protein